MKNVKENYLTIFRKVAASAILYQGEHVANIVVKYPNPGAERLSAFVHWHGLDMVAASVGGGGYDKTAAAISKAAADLPHSMGRNEWLDLFRAALVEDSGTSWSNRLRDAGFKVIDAI